MKTKGRKVTGWILAGLLTALFFMSAMGKVMAGPEAPMTQAFMKYGLEGKLMLIAAGEAIAAILFLVPNTAPLGVLLLSGHMGGAIATHMEHGEPYVFPSLILLVIWITAAVRNPEMFSRMKGEG